MEKITIDVPAMYGDHHVVEVRRILLALDGVTEVYASSAFHLVDVAFDAGKIDEEAITARLDEAGYLGELTVPVETGEAATEIAREEAFFRHTTAYVQTKEVVGFGQRVPSTGRGLWPCPGMGLIRTMED